jgi:integral membrane protein (TIGR01906 family)
MRDKFLTAILGVAIVLFIITFSISLPIYCRFFYYLQINPLSLPEITGYDYDTIKQAYDQMLNYLTLPEHEFGTGVFSYTQAGKAHFEDCRVLFNLNVITLILSSITCITILILNKKSIISLKRPFGMHVAFTSAVSIFVFFGIILALVSIDFNAAFTVFHMIFFPGKDNWQFSYKDQIIYALPQQFFMNCAILIACSIFVISTSIIVFQIVKKKKAKPNEKNDENE